MNWFYFMIGVVEGRWAVYTTTVSTRSEHLNELDAEI